MTPNEIRQHAREGIKKLNPIIRNAGNMVADAYQLGFDTGLALGEKICRDICIEIGVDPENYLSGVKEKKPTNPEPINPPNSALLG